MSRRDRRSTNQAMFVLMDVIRNSNLKRNMNMPAKNHFGRPNLEAIFSLLNLSESRKSMVREEMEDHRLRQSSLTTMITPSMAKEMLKFPMYHQRPKNKAQQNRLSDTIQNNTFGRGNSLSLCVLPNGESELIDGQNRLGAVVLSEQPVSLNMAFIPCKNDEEIKAEAMRTDNHNTRGNSDHAQIAGVPDWFSEEPQYINHPVPGQWSKSVVGASKTLIRSGIDPQRRFSKKELRDPDRKMVYLRHYWERSIIYLNVCVYGEMTLSFESKKIQNPERQKMFLQGPVMAAGLLIFEHDRENAVKFFKSLGATTGPDINGPLGGIDSYLSLKGFTGKALCAPGAQTEMQTIYAMCRAFLAFKDNEDMSETRLKQIIRWKLKHSKTPSDPFNYVGCKK